MQPKFAALLTALAFAAAAPAMAADPTAATTNPDLQFAAEAASGGHAEVAMAKEALQKTNRADLRSFAQRMVDDHTKMNRQLASLAEHQHLRLPRQAEGDDAAAVKRLSALSGAQFDQAFVEQMVNDHRKTVDAFRTEAQNGEVAPLKTLAASALPTLEEHLAMAEQLAQTGGEEKAQAPKE
jgi:putative membrane protein